MLNNHIISDDQNMTKSKKRAKIHKDAQISLEMARLYGET